MKKRVISAIVFIAVTLAFLLTGRIPRILFALICGCIACHEICKALKTAGHSMAPVLGYLFLACSTLVILFGWKVSPLLPVLLFVFFALIVPIFAEDVRPSDMLLSLGVCLYPLALVVGVMWALSLDAPYWYIIVITGALSAVLTDTFALFGGKKFGKNKLCPRISPNKTVEGAVCGFLAAVAGGVLLYFIFFPAKIGASLWQYVVISTVGSVVGQFGDLIASSFKREADIKDFSNLIPGHGGMLDRLDSLLFSICSAAVLFQLFGIIA